MGVACRLYLAPFEEHRLAPDEIGHIPIIACSKDFGRSAIILAIVAEPLQHDGHSYKPLVPTMAANRAGRSTTKQSPGSFQKDTFNDQPQ